MTSKSNSSQYIYHTRGVCPPEIHFKINNECIQDIRFVGGGCPGNAQLGSRLLDGKPIAEVLECLIGIDCRNGTSCSDQLASAIRAVQNGKLDRAESFRVEIDAIPRKSIGLIGDLGGDNRVLEYLLDDMQDRDVESVLCLGNLIGNSPHSQRLIKTIRKKKIPAVQGEHDWHYSQSDKKSGVATLDPRSMDWLYQLPQVRSFRLNTKKCMAFYGDYIQSFAGYSDFEPFALEMNMVCGLTDFMRDEAVFPALEAMTPQFQSDVIFFSQMKSWRVWHVGGRDFISVGAAADGADFTWGLLTECRGKADLKVMRVIS